VTNFLPLKPVAPAAACALRPSVVTISVARKLLGDKSRSEIYEAIARNDLEALKDGNKTIITVASIEKYIARLPRAKIGRAFEDDNNSSPQKSG
jgi:hypothetical protein